MKIIQLLGSIDGYGITRYVLELNSALKKIGHNVEYVHFKSNIKPSQGTQHIPDIITYEYGQELIDKLNSCDILLINTLIDRKANDEHRKNFYKCIMQVTNPIIAIFCNDHNSTIGFSTYVSEFTNDLEFVKHINKFVTFSPYNPNFQKIYKLYPDIMKKYVHLQHPYMFGNIDHVDYDDKYRRISYIGRFSLLKDPMFLVRNREKFAQNNYQLEMRGLDKSPAVAFMPGLIYDFHEDGSRTRAMHTIDFISKKSIKEKYPEDDQELIHLNDRDINKVYLFGRYKREQGIEAASYSMFGCNFNQNRKNPLCLGNNIEYTIAEIVDAGTIPLLNYVTMENCRIYDKESKLTNKCALDYDCGICFKKDATNIDEAIAKLNELASDKEKYDAYRKSCLEFYKELYDPIKIATRLVNDLTSDDNREALAEFGF